MTIITKSGIVVDSNSTDFKPFIYELHQSPVSSPYQLVDDFNYSVAHKKIHNLYAMAKKRIFPNDQLYNDTYRTIPVFTSSLGISSDDPCSRDDFESILSMLKKSSPDLVPIINQYLYLEDVYNIISSVQNLLIGMHHNFISYYLTISKVNPFILSQEKVWRVTGFQCELVSSSISSYFIKACSILDLLTKICFELDYSPSYFLQYQKLRSSNLLYGGRKHLLKMNSIAETIFCHDSFICTLEAIRNEVVHNGSWESFPSVYIRTSQNEVKERFMLFPDFIDGHYEKFVNRNHFYSQGLKVNDELPKLHQKFMLYLINTISKMTEFYPL